MKIGVALSGCDIGGASAFYILRALEDAGLAVSMVSACCAPAASAMLYACRCREEKAEKLADLFVRAAREQNMDAAIAAVADQVPKKRLRGNKTLAVNAVHVDNGKIVTFTNAFALEGERLSTVPLADAYDALSATASLADGLGSYRYESFRLCDFSSWYGCPLYPLKLCGLPRTVSVSFLPETPGTPYEALVRQSIARSSGTADVHVPVVFPKAVETLDGYVEFAAAKLESCMDEILRKTT